MTNGTSPEHPTPHPRSWLERLAGADAVVAPVLFFLFVYVGVLALLSSIRFPLIQWTGLIGVSAATVIVLLVWEKGRWNLGLVTSPQRAVREFLSGSLAGVLLIGACGAIVAWTTPVWHSPGLGFPWLELVAVFLPAAVHEELLFRGYVFQKMRRWRRGFTIVFLALVFAALHGGNEAVSYLGLFNIFLGGVLLALAYERHLRLWFPIGLHLAWNVMTGPVLGHEVSGYESMRTLFVERGHGPSWLTGGDFGIEGSIWMTVLESAVILLLAAAPQQAPQGPDVVEYDGGGRASAGLQKEPSEQ